MITGSGTTETVECEGEAVAGQILCSAGTAALLEPRRLGRVSGDRRILRNVAAGAAPVPEIDRRVVGAGVAAFVPTIQREQILAGRPSEHRRVHHRVRQVLAYRRAGRRDGPNALHDRRQALAECVAAAEREFGVHWLASDVYPDGGKIILTAGAPVSLGDDEERMLRATRSIVAGTVGTECAGCERRPGLRGEPRLGCSPARSRSWATRSTSRRARCRRPRKDKSSRRTRYLIVRRRASASTGSSPSW